MVVHKVSGRFLRDALERALAAYGADAVVVSQRPDAAGGVTLAVADGAPQSGAALVRLRSEAEDVLAQPIASEPAPRAATADVARCLKRSGASDEFTARICAAVEARLATGAHPLDLAGEEIAAALAIARAPRVGASTLVFALLGPAGAGKGACAAKLAARWARAQRVALASLDAHSLGQVEHMRALGARLGVPAAVFQDGARLARALDSERAPAIVVLEGSARAERDLVELERFEKACAERDRAVHVERMLVLPATAADELLERTLSQCPATACAVTMLDQTTRGARVLEHAARAGLGVAFLCNGPELEALHRATPALFADIFLRGRIA